MTVRDVIISAMYMLNMVSDAGRATSTGGTNEVLERFIRLFNLVAREVGEEYRRGGEVKTSYGVSDDIPEFYGITGRMLAYGIAAEFCIAEGMEEAVTWDKRYKDALGAAKKKATRIKSRKFY